MKKISTLAFLAVATGNLLAQNDTLPADTNRVQFGDVEILIIDHRPMSTVDSNAVLQDGDEGEQNKKRPVKEWMEKPHAHWAGLDMGFGVNMNQNFSTDFDANPYWENDPSRSMQWNLNIFEHKFKIAQNYFGITTGLGFQFNQMALKDNYLLLSNADSVYAIMDTVQSYSKNKLRSNYLTVPLLLEFGGKKGNGFYLATGVIGGVRLSSKVKREGEIDGKRFKENLKGVYSLNPFKLDATIRLGYNWFGVYANYNLVPIFEKNKTVCVYPLTFGVTANF